MMKSQLRRNGEMEAVVRQGLVVEAWRAPELRGDAVTKSTIAQACYEEGRMHAAV